MARENQRQRQYDWRTEGYRRKQFYRAARAAAGVRSTELIRTILPALHGSSHQNGEVDEINVAGLSGRLADPQLLQFLKAAVLIGTRPAVNLIDGTNVVVGVADDNPNDRVNVTVGLDQLIQSGSQAFVGITATVTFPVAYSAPPIVATSLVKVTGAIQAHNITVAPTTTGFTATRTAPVGAATLNWIARGAP
jgi:hypothetical protein